MMATREVGIHGLQNGFGRAMGRERGIYPVYILIRDSCNSTKFQYVNIHTQRWEFPRSFPESSSYGKSSKLTWACPQD
jgi:hypothetical protein